MAIKGLMEGLPENTPNLEEPCPICLMTKATKITRGPTTDVLKFAPGFMLQMDFSFFNVEIIHRFTSTFVAICSANSYPFGFPSRSKFLPLDILKFLVATSRNQDKKVAFIQVDEDVALARSSESMKTCHNMNIIVKNTVGDASYLNGKIEIPNKTLSNITRALLLYSSHKNKLWCFTYQYAICLYHLTENILHGDVTNLLWHGKRPSYKHIKIWGVRVYIIDGRVTINIPDDGSH